MSIVKVAALAGVSKSTVSRVINHVPGVGEPLRQRVMKAMKELDYQPSPRRPGPKPASRRGVKSGNVLLLVAGFEASAVYRLPIFPDILHGIETALAEAGMNLVMAGLRDEGTLPASLASDQCDGVLMIGSYERLNPAVRRALATIPTIVLLRTFEQFAGPYDRVLYNNRSVGPMAAKHLLSLGHVHAAFLNSDPKHQAFEQRRQMFTEAMTAAGGRVVDLAIDPASRTPQHQVDLQIKILKQASPAVTCLCTSSDHVLSYVYPALRGQGLEPQKDIAIISCDNDQAVINVIDPKPSTIDIRAEAIGRLAIRQLRWRLANPNEEGPVAVSVQPKLIVAG